MFDKLIENAVKRAQENGDFDNLPGAGKPMTPETLNADPFAHAFKESEAMTPFGKLQRRIDSARDALRNETDPARQHALKTEIALLETQKAVEMETWKRY